ncbi:MAG: single-stranded-DNA-specific exonuclease RecJ, partial [Mesorhizobium amorphae]
YIPDRIFEGYGPNPEAMRALVGRGASLVVTVDCGTNSAAAILAAEQAGADVVVLDHHQVSGPLPLGVPVVNPNRDDDLSGQGHLCAAGVVFLALVRARRLMSERMPDAKPIDLLQLLDLVALATVCDVVPLVGVNRAFVRRGLDVLATGRNSGLVALSRASRLAERANAYHLGFLLGPRINAGGRIGDAGLGSRLLATDDPGEADRIAAQLETLNRERQDMEAVMLAEARAEAEAELSGGTGPAVLVTASDTWHPGVVGLLASRLKDQARRPSFAIAFNKQGIGTGSGRSVSGFDLGRLVRRAVETGLLEKGGGHAMAAGITLRRENLAALRAFFEQEAQTAVSKLLADETLALDAAVSAEGATLALLDEIEAAGPFGAGHPAPTFVLPRHRVADMRVVGANHLQLQLSSPGGGRIKAMAFRAADTQLAHFLRQHQGEPLHFAGSLSGNFWNGVRRVEFRVSDVAEAR